MIYGRVTNVGLNAKNLLLVTQCEANFATAMGEGFVDPDTGEVLGAEEELVAVVKVTDLRAKYSVAEIVIQNKAMAVGDIARRLQSADAKALGKAIKECSKDSAKAKKACDKDSKRCEQYSEEAQEGCAAILGG